MSWSNCGLGNQILEIKIPIVVSVNLKLLIAKGYEVNFHFKMQENGITYLCYSYCEWEIWHGKSMQALGELLWYTGSQRKE